MNNNHNNKFFDGFLWGAIIGGGLVFILGTKKGKKILKMITEEGVEGLSEILEAQMDEGDLEDGEEMENMTEAPEEPLLRGNGVSKNSQSKESQGEAKSSRKRFFRKKSS
ncbi:MAG: hypothetical protein AAB609_02950 [Patescibacteria group bacterium]